MPPTTKLCLWCERNTTGLYSSYLCNDCFLNKAINTRKKVQDPNIRQEITRYKAGLNAREKGLTDKCFHCGIAYERMTKFKITDKVHIYICNGCLAELLKE